MNECTWCVDACPVSDLKAFNNANYVIDFAKL